MCKFSNKRSLTDLTTAGGATQVIYAGEREAFGKVSDYNPIQRLWGIALVLVGRPESTGGEPACCGGRSKHQRCMKGPVMFEPRGRVLGNIFSNMLHGRYAWTFNRLNHYSTFLALSFTSPSSFSCTIAHLKD